MLRIYHCITLCVILLNSSLASAAEPSHSPVSTTSMAIQVILALGIVMAAIFALGWLVKRLGNTHLLQQKNMKMISTMPLGTREKVVLMEVENKKILLGVTPHQISSLHVFDLDEELPQISSSETGFEEKNDTEEEKWDFTRYFKKIIREGDQDENSKAP